MDLMGPLTELIIFIFIVSLFSGRIISAVEAARNWLFSISPGHFWRKFLLFLLAFAIMPAAFVEVSKKILIPMLRPDHELTNPLFIIPYNVVRVKALGKKLTRMEYPSTDRKNMEASFANHIINRPKLPGEYRVAVVGNSIGFGGFVDENKIYSTLLENKFRKEKIPVHLYNLCVHGANPLETLILIREAIKRKADCILWVASYRECAPAYNQGIKIEPTMDTPYLVENSLIGEGARRKLRDFGTLAARQLREKFPFLEQNAVYRGLMHYLVRTFFGDKTAVAAPGGAKPEEIFIPFEETLSRTAKLCRENKVRILAVYMPSPKSIMKQEMKKEYDQWGGKNRPFEMIDSVFRGNGENRNTDLTGVFPENLFHDGFHMNNEGNQFLAGFLFPKLKELYQEREDETRKR